MFPSRRASRFSRDSSAPDGTPPDGDPRDSWRCTGTSSQRFSGYENKAKLALEDAIRRYGRGATVSARSWSPRSRWWKSSDGQKKTTTRKVYPGYMFVQMDIDNETWHVVTSTPKVTGFIGGSSQPPPMPEAEVAHHAPSRGRRGPKPVVHFERGEESSRHRRSFRHHERQGRRGQPDPRQAARHGEIFGRPTSVEFDFTQVERLG